MRLRSLCFVANEPAHVATQEEQIGKTTENSQWSFPLERVSHDGCSVGEFEFVHVPEPFERALDHFIDEPVWPIERRDPSDESLSDTKVAAFEGNNVADFKQPLCPARLNDALRGECRRLGVSVHVPLQIKAELDRFVDSSFV